MPVLHDTTPPSLYRTGPALLAVLGLRCRRITATRQKPCGGMLWVNDREKPGFGRFQTYCQRCQYMEPETHAAPDTVIPVAVYYFKATPPTKADQ